MTIQRGEGTYRLPPGGEASYFADVQPAAEVDPASGDEEASDA